MICAMASEASKKRKNSALPSDLSHSCRGLPLLHLLLIASLTHSYHILSAEPCQVKETVLNFAANSHPGSLFDMFQATDITDSEEAHLLVTSTAKIILGRFYLR